jgi:hypothetical protein
MAENNDYSASSILARSQQQTAQSLKNIKKLNRRTTLFAGLSAVDQFRKSQAISRAEDFYTTHSRYLQNEAKLFDNAVTFWNNHEQNYGDYGSWTDGFWLEKAKEFGESNAFVEGWENKIIEDGEYRGQSYLDHAADVLRRQGTYNAEYQAYQNLYNLYNNENLRPGEGITDEQLATMRADWLSTEKTRIEGTMKKIARSGGLLNDIKNILGVGRRIDDELYTASSRIQVPEDASEEARNFFDAVLRNKDKQELYFDAQSTYNRSVGQSIEGSYVIAPQAMLTGDIFLDAADLKNEDFERWIQANTAGSGLLGSQFENLNRDTIRTDEGLTVSPNEYWTLNRRDPRNQELLIPETVEGVNMNIEALLRLADEDQLPILIDNFSKTAQRFSNIMQKVADETQMTEYSFLASNPEELINFMFQTMDYKDIFGITGIQGESLSVARTDLTTQGANHTLMVNAVRNYSGREIAGLEIFENSPVFRRLPDGGLNLLVTSGESLVDARNELEGTGEGDPTEVTSLEELTSQLRADRQTSEEVQDIYNTGYDDEFLTDNPEQANVLLSQKQQEIQMSLLAGFDDKELLLDNNPESLRRAIMEIANDSSIFRPAPTGGLDIRFTPRESLIPQMRPINRDIVTDQLIEMINSDIGSGERTFLSLNQLDDEGYYQALRNILSSL